MHFMQSLEGQNSQRHCAEMEWCREERKDAKFKNGMTGVIIGGICGAPLGPCGAVLGGLLGAAIAGGQNPDV
jgi:hypothetical protein